MDDYINYLEKNLNLYDYTLIKTTNTKAVIIKTYFKYTKCIYISYIDDFIEIRIDKIFDFYTVGNNIERLIIPRKTFNSLDDSLNYIQKNIAN